MHQMSVLERRVDEDAHHRPDRLELQPPRIRQTTNERRQTIDTKPLLYTRIRIFFLLGIISSSSQNASKQQANIDFSSFFTLARFGSVLVSVRPPGGW